MTEMISTTGILTAGFIFSFAFTTLPPIVKKIEVTFLPCATSVRSNVNPKDNGVIVTGVMNKHRDCTPLAITAQAYDTKNVLAPSEPLRFQNLEPYRARDEMVPRPLGLQLYGPWSLSKPAAERARVEVDVHHETPLGSHVRTRFLEFELGGGDASE